MLHSLFKVCNNSLLKIEYISWDSNQGILNSSQLFVLYIALLKYLGIGAGSKLSLVSRL